MDRKRRLKHIEIMEGSLASHMDSAAKAELVGDHELAEELERTAGEIVDHIARHRDHL